MPNPTISAAAIGCPEIPPRLAALPLIGGGITLIGHPTRAAEPITEQLLATYRQWLFGEWLRVGDELGVIRPLSGCSKCSRQRRASRGNASTWP